MIEQLWLPITIALFGNTVAILIVILTNQAAYRRERMRQTHESLRWSREDAWKIGEIQRGYYFALYAQLREAAVAIHNAGYGIGPPLQFNWQKPAFDALEQLRVFGSTYALAHAEAAYFALYEWGSSGEGGYETPAEANYDAKLESYIKAVRRDIGIAESEPHAGSKAVKTAVCSRCGHKFSRKGVEPTNNRCPMCMEALP